jgi:proteasome lid subunit RPN8/RPN11
MHAQEQVKALLDIDQHGWELIAIYHSHPHGPGEPSERDTKEYSYPGVIYIIHNRLAKQPLRAFRFIEVGWLEIPVTVANCEQLS